MKKLLVMVAVAILTGCDNDVPEPKEDAAFTAPALNPDTAPFPYKALYSSTFVIGDPRHAKIVLDLWKDWETGNLDNHSASFADSVTFMFHNGIVFKGSRDSLVAVRKKARSAYSSIKGEVYAWVPVNSVDKNEDWVDVWGKEVFTKNGRTDSLELAESWKIKNGKVSLIQQYGRSAHTGSR